MSFIFKRPPILPRKPIPPLKISLQSFRGVDQPSMNLTTLCNAIVSLGITPLTVGKTGRFVAIHDDQTELAMTREALQMTSEELHNARDEERQRIAVELHDSTSQHLAAIAVGLANLRKALPAGGAQMVIVDEIARSLNEAAKETRVLSYLMEPRGMGRKALSAAVRQFLEGFSKRTGLALEFKIDGGIDVASPALQHAALRIVQEALLNANRPPACMLTDYLIRSDSFTLANCSRSCSATWSAITCSRRSIFSLG